MHSSFHTPDRLWITFRSNRHLLAMSPDPKVTRALEGDFSRQNDTLSRHVLEFIMGVRERALILHDAVA